MRDRYLFCRCCAVLTPTGAPGGWRPVAEAGDDEVVAGFRAAHAGHEVLEAERLDERPCTDRPPAEPMATRWFRVCAAGTVYAVRSWRPALDEPRRYVLEPAGLPDLAVCVDVDEPLLRRALDRHFFPQVLRAAQIEGVLDAVRALLAPLDPDRVETSFDDATRPDTAVGPLPAALHAPLVTRCAPLFDAGERERLLAFIRAHAGADGALALRVQRTLAIRAA